MSWIPAFEIGLWNAWILMFFSPINPLLLVAVDKIAGSGDIFKKMGDQPRSSRVATLNTVFIAIQGLLVFYSIFLPLYVGCGWLYAGLAIYLVGLVIFIAAAVVIATTPLGSLFSQGPYRYSRHPGYLSMLIVYIGISAAAASWLFLLLTILLGVMLGVFVNEEERGCLEIFGDAYQVYMIHTPKWFGLPK